MNQTSTQTSPDKTTTSETKTTEKVPNRALTKANNTTKQTDIL